MNEHADISFSNQFQCMQPKKSVMSGMKNPTTKLILCMRSVVLEQKERPNKTEKSQEEKLNYNQKHFFF